MVSVLERDYKKKEEAFIILLFSMNVHSEDDKYPSMENKTTRYKQAYRHLKLR